MAIKMKKTPRFKKIWLSFLAVFLLATMFVTPQVIAAAEKTAREKAIEYAYKKVDGTERFAVNITFGAINEEACKAASSTKEKFSMVSPGGSIYFQLIFNNKSSVVKKVPLPASPIAETRYFAGFITMNCKDFGSLKGVKLIGSNLAYTVDIAAVDVTHVIKDAYAMENWTFYGNTDSETLSTAILSNKAVISTNFAKGSMSVFYVKMHTMDATGSTASKNTQMNASIEYKLLNNWYETVFFDLTFIAKQANLHDYGYQPFTTRNKEEKFQVFLRDVKNFNKISFTSNSWYAWWFDVCKIDATSLDPEGEPVSPKGIMSNFSRAKLPTKGASVHSQQKNPEIYDLDQTNTLFPATGHSDFAKYDVEQPKAAPDKVLDIYLIPNKGTKIESDVTLKLNWLQSLGNYPVSQILRISVGNTVEENGVTALYYKNIPLKDFKNLTNMLLSVVSIENVPSIDYVLFNIRDSVESAVVTQVNYADVDGIRLSEPADVNILDTVPERLKQTQKVSICTAETLDLKDGEDVFVSLQYNDIAGNPRIGEYQSLSKLGVKSLIQGQTTTANIPTEGAGKVTGINLYRTGPTAPVKVAEGGGAADAVSTKLDMVYVESYNSEDELISYVASPRVSEDSADPNVPKGTAYQITTDKKSADQAYPLSAENVAYKNKIEFKTGSDAESSTMCPIICKVTLKNGAVVTYQLDDNTLLGVAKAFTEGTTSSLNVILNDQITSITLQAKPDSGDDLWKLESVSFTQQQLGTKTPAEVVSRTINSWIGNKIAKIPLVGDIDIPKVKEEPIPVPTPTPDPPTPDPPTPDPPTPDPPTPDPPTP